MFEISIVDSSSVGAMFSNVGYQCCSLNADLSHVH